MRPRADQVMKSIIWTFDEYVLTDPTTPLAKSYALTISNMLRHVQLRLEREGPLLVEDNADLRRELEAVVAYAEQHTDNTSLQALQTRLAADLAREIPDDRGYRGVFELTTEADVLRAALDYTITALQTLRALLGSDTSYVALRDALRAYMERQYERENKLIDEAFIRGRR